MTGFPCSFLNYRRLIVATALAWVAASTLHPQSRAAYEPYVLTDAADGAHDIVTADFLSDGNPLLALADYGADAVRFAGRNTAGFTEPPRGRYYDDANAARKFSGKRRSRTDASIDFDWGNDAPFPTNFGADSFSVRWTAKLRPAVSGTYEFTTESDDGVRLFIDGRKIIDRWQDQSPARYSGEVRLSAGREYELQMDYYENGGGAVARLFWQPPGGKLSVLPVAGGFSRLGRADAGLGPIALAAGDFNGDGRIDLAACNYNYGGTITLLYGRADGLPGRAKALPAGHDPFRIAAGDWNADGTADLAVLHKNSPELRIYENDTPHSIQLDGMGIDLVATQRKTGDRLVVLVKGAGGPGLVVFARSDGGEYQKQQIPLPNDFETGRLAEANGQIILALAGEKTGVLLVVEIDAGKKIAQQIELPGAPNAVAVMDLDRDGRPDVLTGSDSVDQLWVYRNGGPSFRRQTTIPIPDGLRAITSGDFDGDGRMEPVTLHQAGGEPAKIVRWGKKT